MDVPGHKGNYLDNEFVQYFGEEIIRSDVNSMKRLDNLNYSETIIKQSQKNIAKLHNAHDSRFLINGTTMGIQIMILSSIKEGEKIIVPKNIHKSVQSALILSGAKPIYADVEFHNKLGIYTKLTLEQIKEKVNKHPDIKACLLINPSYYGVSYEFEKIVKFLKDKNIIILVDEAHGGIFYTQDVGCSAMEAGADMSVISYHKTLGTLTQTSLLLYNSKLIDINKVDEVFTMLTTTSPSYLLMTNLEVTILDVFQNKLLQFPKMIQIVNEYKDKINDIDGLCVVDYKYLNLKKKYFDPMRLVISVEELTISGYEAYELLRDEYNIQCELGESNVILCIITIFDRPEDLNRLVAALEDLAKKNSKSDYNEEKAKIIIEEKLLDEKETSIEVSPREIFYKTKELIHYKDAVGRVIASSIMLYPPGIPIILQGTKITQQDIYKITDLKKADDKIYGIYDGKIYVIT